jgi:hypothetical protein
MRWSLSSLTGLVQAAGQTPHPPFGHLLLSKEKEIFSFNISLLIKEGLREVL